MSDVSIIALPRGIRFGCHDTRQNLPRVFSAKRGEANFLRQFERAYFANIKNAVSCDARGREFALEGYGRADIVWLAWSKDEDFTAVSLLRKVQITAIEAKLKDWRKGLMQAARYRYFANQTILVLPPQASSVAVGFLENFRKLGVGLWEFDPQSGVIIKHTTPRKKKPLSALAYARALKIITCRLKLG